VPKEKPPIGVAKQENALNRVLKRLFNIQKRKPRIAKEGERKNKGG